MIGRKPVSETEMGQVCVWFEPIPGRTSCAFVLRMKPRFAVAYVPHGQFQLVSMAELPKRGVFRGAGVYQEIGGLIRVIQQVNGPRPMQACYSMKRRVNSLHEDGRVIVEPLFDGLVFSLKHEAVAPPGEGGVNRAVVPHVPAEQGRVLCEVVEDTNQSGHGESAEGGQRRFRRKMDSRYEDKLPQVFPREVGIMLSGLFLTEPAEGRGQTVEVCLERPFAESEVCSQNDSVVFVEKFSGKF